MRGPDGRRDEILYKLWSDGARSPNAAGTSGGRETSRSPGATGGCSGGAAAQSSSSRTYSSARPARASGECAARRRRPGNSRSDDCGSP